MQRQLESLLENNLVTSLQHNLRLFDSQTDRSLADTLALTPRISLTTNLKLHATEPSNPNSVIVLQRHAKTIQATGFAGVAICDADNIEYCIAARHTKT